MSICSLPCHHVYAAIYLLWQDGKNADSCHASSFSKERKLSVKTKCIYGENLDFADKLFPGSEITLLY